MRFLIKLVAPLALGLGLVASPLLAQNDSEGGKDGAPARAAVFDLVGPDGVTHYSAVRVTRDLVVIAKGLKKDDALTGPKDDKGKKAKDAPAPEPLAGKVIEVTDDLSLARFKQSALEAAKLPVVHFARAQASFGDFVRLISKDESQDSAMLESANRLFLIPRGEIAISGHVVPQGAILFNGCDELTGVVSAEDDRSGAVRALSQASIAALVDKGDGEVERADKVCKGNDDGLDRLADRTRDRAKAARQAASDADREAAEIQARMDKGDYGRGGKAGAAKRLDELKREAANDRATAKRADDRIDVINDYRRSHDRDRIFAVLLLAIALAVVIVALVLWRHSRNQVRDRERSISFIAQQVNEIEQRLDAEPWRNVVLSGPSGLLKVSAEQLADGGQGAVIGRSERNADVTFSPPDVSRQHARLFVRDGTLWIEDLGSAGGTFVRGRKVDPDAPVSIANGDMIRLAAHEFKVNIA